MNKQRFNEFKSDLKEAFGLIIQRYPDVNDFVYNVWEKHTGYVIRLSYDRRVILYYGIIYFTVLLTVHVVST